MTRFFDCLSRAIAAATFTEDIGDGTGSLRTASRTHFDEFSYGALSMLKYNMSASRGFPAYFIT